MPPKKKALLGLLKLNKTKNSIRTDEDLEEEYEKNMLGLRRKVALEIEERQKLKKIPIPSTFTREEILQQALAKANEFNNLQKK